MFPIRPYSPARCLCVVAGAFAGAVSAQTVPVPALTLRPAADITMPTEPGRVYQWQSSADLISWRNDGDPIFGTGNPVSKPVGGEAMRFFRLQILDAPAMGNAPWSLAGSSTQFNEGNRTLIYHFNPNGQGTAVTGGTSRPFAWSWLRNGLSCGESTLTYADSSREVIHWTYTAPRTGQFFRQSFLGTRLDRTDEGTFGPLPVGGTPLVPASIVGRPLALSGVAAASGLTLTQSNGGTRLLDGRNASFAGNWLVTGNSTARLIASFSPTHGEEYRFTFTSPLTGRYTRVTYTEGVFRDQDEGTFCLHAQP